MRQRHDDGRTLGERPQRIERFSDADVGAPVNEAEIAAAEERIGRFPEQYRWLVAELGWLEAATVSVLGLGENVSPHLNVVAETESERDDFEPGLPDGHIVISPDGAGNVYTLRAGAESAVYFRDHETGDADEDAPDFLSWLLEQLEAASEPA